MKKRQQSPPPPGPHFTVGELVGIRGAIQALAWNVEVRLIHHLALPCPECWATVYALPPMASGKPESAEPVVRALGRLGMPNEDVSQLTEVHRRALAEPGNRPLAFCELLLEEAWLAVQESSDTPAEDLYAAFGPIGGNGVCLLAPREAHDLQARFFTYLAEAYREAGEARPAANAAALAKAHLARGTTAKQPPGPTPGPSGAKTGRRAPPRKTARPRARRSK
jgi:hypothetical protein